jgi:hypothetical protein
MFYQRVVFDYSDMLVGGWTCVGEAGSAWAGCGTHECGQGRLAMT